MTQENITHFVSAGAISSPLWLHELQNSTEAISEYIALWLPILGALWLLVQIWAKLKSASKGKPDE